MASRKEEKERLREAREKAEAEDRRQERKRLMLGYVVAGLLSAAIVAGIVVAIASGGGDNTTADAGDNARLNEAFGVVPDGVKVDDRESSEAPGSGGAQLEEAAAAANCELLLNQKDEGNTHIPESADLPDYESNPPTSGDHLPDPLADGAYITAPSPLNFIHGLEHGRVEVQYSSDLPEEDQLQLLGLYDEDRAGMMLFPNDDMPYLVAATAWLNTMGCDSYEGEKTLDAIRAFRGQFRGRGPEPVPIN